MTLTPQVFAFLTYITVMMVFCCKADHYPPPTQLSYKWLDPFTVNLSWEKPAGLPDTGIKFKVHRKDKPWCVQGLRNFTEFFLTKELGDQVTYTIQTVRDCGSPTNTTSVTITVRTQKPQGHMVKDFECQFKNVSKEMNWTLWQMNCSWTPVNKFQDLTLSYRMCGQCEECIKSLKKCNQTYSSGQRNGCVLLTNISIDNICILVENKTAMTTFKPVLVAPPPQLNITEEGDYLKLNWTLPETGKPTCWSYMICHTRCNKNEKCQNTSTGETEMMVPYDKRCRYEFHSKVIGDKTCLDSLKFSKFSDIVSYGTNVSPDEIFTVVAIVIPIILSLCVILSCYCFRRHSAIICPVIPDPSVIFKEFMMNGNKELKTTTGNLYTPVPEVTEQCNITTANENSVLPQNS